MTAQTQPTRDEANDKGTAEIAGSPDQVAEMVAMAFNSGKDVTLKSDGDVSELHNEFANTRDEHEMTVESSNGVTRLSFSAFYVPVVEETKAYIHN